MVFDHRQQYTESLRSTIYLAVYPIQLLVNLPADAGHWLDENIASRTSLLEENASLRKQDILLRGQLQKLEALEQENLRLRNLLDATMQIGKRVLIAELLSVDLDPYKHLVTINKGSVHGVYQGQPVIDATGVMGQISHVSPLTSTALLVTDLSHAIPVQVNRNGLRTIAVGGGTQGILKLPYLPNNADIQNDDLLITSGLGGRFPVGYPVGRVTGVNIDLSTPYAQITLESTARTSESRVLLLVWPAEDFIPETEITDKKTSGERS